MKREQVTERLQEGGEYDFIIVGGGASGLGVGLEAASRGYSALLLEKHDFCKGTSSRSTKLIHGGVRYLSQGNVSLVRDALRERGYLMRNAPHLVHRLPMVLPVYKWWEKLYYGFGLKVYERLSGGLSLGKTEILDRRAVWEAIPGLSLEGLRGGVLFFDGQFDDSQLGISMMRSMAEAGGVPLNYFPVTDLLREGKRIKGVRARDHWTGREYSFQARVVVNATGPFADGMRRLADPDALPRLSVSQGSHIVLPARFLGGRKALLVPKTDDGRVLFAIPWLGRVLAGTTDIPVEEPNLEPQIKDSEIDFILAHLSRYLSSPPTRKDVLSVFAGLRPLLGEGGEEARTSALSRDHQVEFLADGFVSLMGGKWTTYRKMAEDTVNQAARRFGLSSVRSATSELQLDTFRTGEGSDGRRSPRVESLLEENPDLKEPLHPNLPYCRADVILAVREGWACTVEDVLSRRTRSLLLDARAAMEVAGDVARMMGRELGWDEQRQSQQEREFLSLAENYLP